MGLHIDRVVTDTAALAAIVGTSPDAHVGCYADWTVVDLGGHVGQIHRWVTGIVAERAQSRPTTPYADPPGATELADWLVAGAQGLVDALAAADPTDAVWTISRADRDIAFWRQRMVLETALHRWDAEDAVGAVTTVDGEVALAGIAETLDVYLAQRLDGADVRGDGRRVAFTTSDDDGWTLALKPEAVRLHADTADADATIRGSVLDLWLLLTCRRGLDGLEVVGDRDLAELAARAATLSPGPAG